MKAGLSHLMKLSLGLALLLTACAPSQTGRAPNQGPATPPRQVGTFTYGFDLSNQEPDQPGSNRSGTPANLPGAVISARRVLASLPGSMVDQAIFGFGAGADPEPSPGHFDMSGIAARLALIEAARDTPVITLVSAPNWMKDGVTGHNSLFNSTPSPDHYQDFAALAAHVAQSFPQVKYFVVWSELRGFWNPATQLWDYQDYTTLYNDVYLAIKRARPDALVGGPYAVMSAEPSPVRHVVSTVHGGGQPTLLADQLPNVLPILEQSPQLTLGEPPGVLVAGDAAGWLAVNTTDRPVTAQVLNSRVTMRPAQVQLGKW